jgi:hypothetical protein
MHLKTQHSSTPSLDFPNPLKPAIRVTAAEHANLLVVRTGLLS